MPIKGPDGKVPWGRYIAGCLTPGEKVLTTNGLKPVEDVTYSDTLINIDIILSFLLMKMSFLNMKNVISENNSNN